MKTSKVKLEITRQGASTFKIEETIEVEKKDTTTRTITAAKSVWLNQYINKDSYWMECDSLPVALKKANVKIKGSIIIPKIKGKKVL